MTSNAEARSFASPTSSMGEASRSASRHCFWPDMRREACDAEQDRRRRRRYILQRHMSVWV
jgi:hypothetical protein